MRKSSEVLTWDEYFIGLAELSSMRSKDPSTRVGACIVDEDLKVVGIGYNGMPSTIPDTSLPWERDGDFLDTKYAYVVHAELNAILNSTRSVRGCTIYVTLHPCNECAKAIVQSGISEVVYLDDKYSDKDSTKASKIILEKAGIKVRQLDKQNKISLFE